MSKRARSLLFVLGVVLGLGIMGGVLLARQTHPEILAPKGETGIAYLSPVTAPEIWRNSPDGSRPLRLTETGGKVFDYDVSPDGRQIVYSAANEQNGLDLWSVPTGGGNSRRLLGCGADSCSGPAYAPDGSQIAYSRRNKAENPGGNTPGLGRIWLMNLEDSETSPLYADAAVAGQDISWSWDGSRLSFFDPLRSAIRVHPIQGGEDLVLPVLQESSGGWSRDDKQLVFSDYAQGQERPVGALTEVDVATGQAKPAFSDLELTDFGSPSFDPGGNWMAVGGQAAGEGSARTIWVCPLKGGQAFRISSDPQASQGAYHWDPAGVRLIYQEYRPGSSEQKPGVYIWDLPTKTTRLVAENASLPEWIP
jgi:TolB protein